MEVGNDNDDKPTRAQPSPLVSTCTNTREGRGAPNTPQAETFHGSYVQRVYVSRARDGVVRTRIDKRERDTHTGRDGALGLETLVGGMRSTYY